MVMTIKKGSDKAQINHLIEQLNLSKSEGIDAYKYCGIITLKETPDQIQKRLRSEWN